MSTVALVASWYLLGFGAAALMIDRGSSPTPWWVAAALLGGVAALLAVAVSFLLRRSETAAPEAPSGHGRHAFVMVGTTDRNREVLRAAALPVERRTVVCTVGAEAYREWIDTGERHAAHRALDDATRRLGPSARGVVAPARAEDVVTQLAASAPVDVVVTGATQLAPVTGGWVGHVLADRAGVLSSTIGAPVLVAPDRAGVPSPSPAPTRSRVA